MCDPPGAYGWLLWLFDDGQHVRGGSTRAEVVEGISVRVRELGHGSIIAACNTWSIVLDWWCEGTNDM